MFVSQHFSAKSYLKVLNHGGPSFELVWKVSDFDKTLKSWKITWVALLLDEFPLTMQSKRIQVGYSKLSKQNYEMWRQKFFFLWQMTFLMTHFPPKNINDQNIWDCFFLQKIACLYFFDHAKLKTSFGFILNTHSHTSLIRISIGNRI